MPDKDTNLSSRIPAKYYKNRSNMSKNESFANPPGQMLFVQNLQVKKKHYLCFQVTLKISQRKL